MNSPEELEQQALEALSQRFIEALQHKHEGRHDDAEDIFREIIRVEPRLAEPHMELARLLLDTDRTEAAEPHAREALIHLEASGQWTDEIPENVVHALAHALLAEILRRRADEDDVIFGDPATFNELVRESRELFEKASSLDPADEYASYHAFFLGARGHGSKAQLPGPVEG